MYLLIGIIILLSILILIFFLYSHFKERLNFYITGLDASFSLSDLNLLWKVSQICDLPQPTALFYSLPALTRCMNTITTKVQQEGSSPSMQLLITKLFNYRTKLQNQSDEKKGLDSTKYLDVGQKLRIIYPGRGVFVSQIVANGKDLVVQIPKQNDLILFPANEWINQTINVYFWRKSDARYVFDTVVEDQAIYLGKPVLKLKHSNQLVRTQKRKSIRAKSNIDAYLFIIREKVTDFSTIETKNGYKCKIEDISESGALVRIGGKGIPNIQIKLQFTINNMLIVMFGEIRTVEYNEKINQSLLHFECTHIDTVMKNEVLKFVYNILPDKDKEILAALTLVDEDEQKDQEDSNSVQNEISGAADNSTDSDEISDDTNHFDKSELKSYNADDGDKFSTETTSSEDEIHEIHFDKSVDDLDELNIF